MKLGQGETRWGGSERLNSKRKRSRNRKWWGLEGGDLCRPQIIEFQSVLFVRLAGYYARGANGLSQTRRDIEMIRVLMCLCPCVQMCVSIGSRVGGWVGGGAIIVWVGDGWMPRPSPLHHHLRVFVCRVALPSTSQRPDFHLLFFPLPRSGRVRLSITC